MENLEEVDKFLETHKLPKLKQEEVENLNIPITRKESKLVIKNLPKNRVHSWMTFQGNSTKHLIRINTYYLEAVPKNRNVRKTSNLFL